VHWAELAAIRSTSALKLGRGRSARAGGCAIAGNIYLTQAMHPESKAAILLGRGQVYAWNE
jgi:hypothetical protein